MASRRNKSYLNMKHATLLLSSWAAIVTSLPTLRSSPDPDATAISVVERPVVKQSPILDKISKILIGPTIPLIGDLQGDAYDDTVTHPRTHPEDKPFSVGAVGPNPDIHKDTISAVGASSRDISTKIATESRESLEDIYSITPSRSAKPNEDDALETTSGDHSRNYRREYELSAANFTSQIVRHRKLKDKLGPNDRLSRTSDTVITLLNATPYRWRKGYNHSYQLFAWEDWPEYIEPGQSYPYFSSIWGPNSDDSAGEVAYHLEGTSKPMSFMVERRKGKKHHTWICFLEDLETKGHSKLSQHDLGYHGERGSVNFVLAGKEGDFYSNDPPVGWMQSLLPEIGNLPLREIIMPRSHHAGLWKSNHIFSHGKHDNTATQYNDLEFQLTQGGARVLDIRPVLHKGQIWEGHGSMVMGAWCGTLGATLDDMIDTINQWQKRNPGELIIWDIHPNDAWYIKATNALPAWYHYKMRPEDREFLYKTFKKLENRLSVPDREDITRWPLERLIGNETSGVLIRVGGNWADEMIFPGGKEGFISPQNFPYNHRWSDTDVEEDMFKDQVDYLARVRPTRTSVIHHADWLLTQKEESVLGWSGSIPDMNRRAWNGLFKELWEAMNENTYPNWIAVDGIQSTELAGLVVAMNHCLAARKCGELGGKVRA